MKKVLLPALAVLLTFQISAQNDTTFYFGNNKIYIEGNDSSFNIKVAKSQMDSSELKLFEGTYGDNYSSEVTSNFTLGKLIQPKKNSRKLRAHDGGIAWGFASLSSRDLYIANTQDAILKPNSYELGFQLGNLSVPISAQHGWLFFTGVGLRFTRYNADLNTAFRIVDHYTRQVPAEEGTFYNVSKLTSWHITIPAMFEWQKRIGKQSFYIQGGVEGAVMFFNRSKAKYTENGKKVKEVIGRQMNVNPITLDVKVGIGYGWIGIYARYGLLRTFRYDRGPDVIPVALGIVIDL